ncbi:MAG TPA: hypothetical protein VM287_04405 [Egibacteraceae bacterium]|nr:hypothetical protein [Egibacteraceae bacterium]
MSEHARLEKIVDAAFVDGHARLVAGATGGRCRARPARRRPGAHRQATGLGVVNEWLKPAVLLSFRQRDRETLVALLSARRAILTVIGGRAGQRLDD